MEINIFSTLLFAFVTTFTPGPNNIISTSMGLIYGYRRSLPFLIGIGCGFLTIMLACSFLSALLNKYLPSSAPYLRIIGATYILWLAYGVYTKSSNILNKDKTKALTFFNGYFLQFVNPKAILYGLTVFSTFLSPILDNMFYIILSSILFASFSFSAISTWALTGHFIRGFVDTPKRAKALGLILSIALVYTAIDLIAL